MNSEELHKRKLVWQALSEFYLDTELDKYDYAYICKLFTDSGYTLEELKDIDTYEVFPTLKFNLLGIAGEWAGFEEEWLSEKCQQNLRKKSNAPWKIMTKLASSSLSWMRNSHWKSVSKIMSKEEDPAIGKFRFTDCQSLQNGNWILKAKVIEGRIPGAAHLHFSFADIVIPYYSIDYIDDTNEYVFTVKDHKQIKAIQELLKGDSSKTTANIKL